MLGRVTSAELPLSVSGQVHRLIAEATSLEKLAAMYVWWMAWCAARNAPTTGRSPSLVAPAPGIDGCQA